MPTISKDDLFRAILAMDVYHRVYNQGVKGLPDTGQIGTATLGRSTDDRSTIADVEHKPIGFFAQEYIWNGESVVVYRGTDSGFTDASATGDIVNGYGIGAARPDGPQARAAVEFYKSIVDGDPLRANVDLIGQSLGGGLADAIGTATWLQSSDDLEQAGKLAGAAAVGFSASEYTLDGKKVISYRGTDFDFSSVSGVLNFINDVVYGWLTSFGATGDEILLDDTQVKLAQDFYKQVTGREVFPPAGSGPVSQSDVLITGHSLGGSLAGFTASLTRSEAVVFNEIPFLGSAFAVAYTKYINGLGLSTYQGNPLSALIDFFRLAQKMANGEVQQAGAVLGAWGAAMPLTQELVAVRLGTDAAGKTVLLDRAEYVEDAAGGYWTLASNAPVLDVAGAAIARATLGIGGRSRADLRQRNTHSRQPRQTVSVRPRIAA